MNNPSLFFAVRRKQMGISNDVVRYAAMFCLAMIGHELALEAASTQFASLDGLASAVTLSQFGFCLLLPLVLKALCDSGPDGGDDGDGPTSSGDGTGKKKGKCSNGASATVRQVFSKFPRTWREFGPYLLLSIIIAGAQTTGTQAAIAYVSYPTKVVFKSAKLIPTMIVATCLHRKRYGFAEYLAAAMLCVGAAGYSYGSGNASSSSGGNKNSWKGIILLTISISCDAIVPNFQKLLMSSSNSSSGDAAPPKPFKKKVSDLPMADGSTNAGASDDDEAAERASLLLSGGKHQQQQQKQGLTASELMINVNAIGVVGLIGYMLVRGEFGTTVATAASHPRLIAQLVAVGLGLSTAVYNYTNLIKQSGSVVAVGVATLRKVVTVLLSYVVFPKPLLGIHVLSGMLVLAGILLSSSVNSNKNGNSARQSCSSDNQQQLTERRSPEC